MGCNSSVHSHSSASSTPAFADPHEVAVSPSGSSAPASAASSPRPNSESTANSPEFSGGTAIVPSSGGTQSQSSNPTHHKRRSSLKGEVPREIAPKSSPIVKSTNQKSILKKTTLINAPVLIDNDENKDRDTMHARVGSNGGPEDPSSTSYNPHQLAPLESQLQGNSIATGTGGQPSQISGNSKNSKTSRGSNKSPSVSPAHSPLLGSKRSRNSRNSPRNDKEARSIVDGTGKERDSIVKDGTTDDKGFSLGPASTSVDTSSTGQEVKISSIQSSADALTVPGNGIAGISPSPSTGGSEIFFSPTGSAGSTPLLSPLPPGGGSAPSDGTQSLRRRRRLQRRTSHRGMLSKLALKFPYVRASVNAVHKVFVQYHLQRLEEEELSKMNSSSISSPTPPLFGNGTVRSNTETDMAIGSAAEKEAVQQQPTITSSGVQLDAGSNSPPPAVPGLDVAAGASVPSTSPNSPKSTILMSDIGQTVDQKPGLTLASPGAAASPASAPDSGSTNPTAAATSAGTGELTAKSRQTQKRRQYDMEAITLDKLHEILCIIGDKKQWTNEEVLDLFHLADLDKSKTISFREFLIAIAIGYFLKVDDVSIVGGDSKFLEIQHGFKVIQDAFKEMDTDNSKSVDAAELKKALFDTVLDTNSSTNTISSSTAAIAAKNHQELLERRFAELDFDHDGDIYFPEFLFGFIGWVFTENEDADGQLNWGDADNK